MIPITVESLISEWMHDWANPKSMELVKEVYSKYGAMIGLGIPKAKMSIGITITEKAGNISNCDHELRT